MTWVHVREGSWCLMIKGRGRKGVYGEEDIRRIREMMKGSLEEEDRQESSPEDLGYNRGKSEGNRQGYSLEDYLWLYTRSPV